MERCWSLNAPWLSSATGSKTLKGFATLTYCSVLLIWPWTISPGLYGSLVFSEPQGRGCVFVFKGFIPPLKVRFWLSDWLQFPWERVAQTAWVQPGGAGTRLSLMQKLGTSTFRYECLAVVMPSSPGQHKALRFLLVPCMQQVVPLSSTNTYQ